MFMTLSALLITAVIFLAAVLPLKIKWYFKALLTGLVIAGSFKNLLARLLGGPLFFAPDLPGGLLLSWTAIYAVACIFFLLQLPVLTGRVLYHLFSKISKKPLPAIRPIVINAINSILLTFSILLTAWSMYNALKLPEVQHFSVQSAQLPDSADRFRIAVLSDLHVDAITRAERIEHIVEITNALHADMIVILGDTVDGTVEQRKSDIMPLQKLSAPAGVYAIPGNHDYYSGYHDWMKFFASLSIKMLINENIRLPQGICLAGIADPAARRTHAPEPDLRQSISGIKDEEFTILLAHRPAVAAEAAAHGIDLQLSGHTHGGMLPLLNLIVGRYNGGFIAGAYMVGNMLLYVSRGSAIWNGFPLRLNCDSEITLITLNAIPPAR